MKKMTIEEIQKVFDEYNKYAAEDKHAVPFKIWLKYKKKFDVHTINQLYDVLEEYYDE